MRKVSNVVDNICGLKGGYNEESSGFIHGVYHTGVSVGKYIYGNSEA